MNHFDQGWWNCFLSYTDELAQIKCDFDMIAKAQLDAAGVEKEEVESVLEKGIMSDKTRAFLIEYKSKTKNYEKCKKALKAFSDVQSIEFTYNKKGWLKQFTVDLIEDFLGDLTYFLFGDCEITEEDVLANLSDKASAALEICNNEIADFHVIKELYDAVKD